MNHKKIKAEEGKIFVRIHDNFKMSNEITLGYDYSTGVKREDKEEYYRQEVAPVEEHEERVFEILRNEVEQNEPNWEIKTF